MYKKINKKKNDVAALKSSVNFFLIKLKHINSTIYQRIMLNFHGILVRDCNSFTGLTGNFIRVAVRKHKDNLKLINAIHEIDTNFNKYELLKNKLL